MAESVNRRIADVLTRRQLQVGRVETGLRRDAWAALALLEADLLTAIKLADPTESAILTRRQRAVETLVEEDLAPLIASRYDRIASMITAALIRLAHSEARTVQDLVNEATGEETLADLPSDVTLRRAVEATLIPTATRPTDLSATGADWWQRQADSLQQRLRDQLLVSVSLEESLPQMVTRVRGTQALGRHDGLMERARQDAARLLATQVTNAVSEAHVAVADANGAMMILMHISTLDARTSNICLARNGLKYTSDSHEPIGHRIPYLGGPPFHPNCRSVMVPLVNDGGPVTDESVTTWFHRQGEAFQDALLGPKRAQMWRAGTLGSLRQLLDAATGRPLTLEELGA